MPVFESGFALSLHIRRQTRNTLLAGSQIQAVAEKVINAGPLVQDLNDRRASIAPASISRLISEISASDVKVKTGKTKDGRCYVRVTGDMDKAEALRMSYEKDGKAPGFLRADRFAKDVWFFYVE
jgi:hypothetical protein